MVRAAGSTRFLQETVPAPQELGIPLIGVPEGSPVDLEVSLEAVHEGIFVSGTAQVHLVGECSRCLDPLAYDQEVDLMQMFFFASPEQGDGTEDQDDEVRLVENDTVDLEPVLRDAVVTALPFQPVCREDCAGLCSECGVRLADHPGHHHEVLDPRWAALSALTQETDQ
ncbi:YceD family protein [Psychromicrobium xiongbiense]|uniref:YceD family protein n=1 Tax=Psychromicrobium xiongbiense TaxID=3051184 RepID=UPI00255459BF|nr:YceD family protein [Psychromicrobium sp. YIM S02556]